jgi:hypothetical protein
MRPARVTQSRRTELVNIQLEWIWKEVAIVQMEVLPEHFDGTNSM